MKFFSASLLIAGIFGAFTLFEDKESRSLDQDAVAIRIVNENDGNLSDPIKPIFIVWPDGKILWSKSDLSGEPPYFVGKIDIKKIEEFRNAFIKNGFSDIKKWNMGRTRVHSPYIGICIKANEKYVEAESDHELIEADGQFVVAFDGSIIDLKNDKSKYKSRLEFLSDQPKDYLMFRLIWSEEKSKILNFRPVSGKEVKIKIISDKISWQE